MFSNDNLKSYLENSSNIETSSLVVAEINMNSADRILKIGNYRHRPADILSDYYTVAATYDKNDADNNYTNATDSDTVFDGGIDEDDNPVAYSSIQTNKKLFYSLEECFGKFRPRSGINKALWLGSSKSRFLNFSNQDMMRRPRYYMASKDDKFKYWTSIRKEGGTMIGLSDSDNFISDAAPFVVYNQKIPTNRIIVKMQTNVGDVDLGPFKHKDLAGDYDDPFYDAENEVVNRTVPTVWAIQYLNSENEWVDAFTFDPAESSPNDYVVPRDGYVELQYVNGSWLPNQVDIDDETGFMKNFTNPTQISGDLYEEFQYIYGLRIVVTEMSKPDATFDLIEMSPRLAVDFTDLTLDFKVNKVASDLGVSGMPVGQLLASNGSITIADFDQALNVFNTDSVIAPFIGKNVQFKFYEILNDDTTNYYVPLKTLYAESFPQFDINERTATIELRDLYFHLESLTAPQILIRNVSFSYAIAMLLDSIGFSNYRYKRVEGKPEPTIPFFFIAPEKTVAEVLSDLAISTQTAMFFDEYNDLILMSRDYILPKLGERPTNVDMILYGTKDFERRNELQNYTDTNVPLANIIELASQENEVFNGGTITYSTRYIQKSYQTIKQASQIDRDKTWIYKPVLLWEVAGEETTKSMNEDTAKQSSYTLSAIPLNSDLTAEVPYVDSNGVVQNNVLDLGDGIYWIGKYNGYFYSSSEIIKFDAVEYNIGKEDIVASGVYGITIPETNEILVDDDNLTSSFQKGQRLVQISSYSKNLDNVRIAGTLSGTNTLTLSSASDANNVFITQELDKVNLSQPPFTNVTLVYPNIVILDGDNDKATTKDILLNSSIDANNTDYRVPNEYIFKLAKNNKKIVVKTSDQNVYDVNNPSLTPSKLRDQMKLELEAVAEGLKKIEIVSTSKEDLEALPQNPRVVSLTYDGKKDSLTVKLNSKARKTRNVRLRIVSTPVRLGANAKVSGLYSQPYTLNGKQYPANKVFTVNVNHSKPGLNIFEKSLVLGATPGSFGTGAEIQAKVSDTIYTLSQNHASTGYVVFTGSVLSPGELDSETAGVPLKISSIDPTSSKKFETNFAPVTHGGVVFNVVNASGNVWISSLEEYQNYFSKIPFGGKLYPTGRVRIYSEPFIDENGNRVPGQVSKHGRGQFGTLPQQHFAGLSSHWTNDDNMAGCLMESAELFGLRKQEAFAFDTIVQSDTYSSNGTKIFILNTDNIQVDDIITETDPGTTLKLQLSTKVTKVESNHIIVDKAPTTRLTGDTITVTGSNKAIAGTTDSSYVELKDYIGGSQAYTNAKTYAKKTTRNSIIKNFLANSYYSDGNVNKLYSTQTGTIQSSALVMQGRDFPDQSVIKPIDFLSIVTKDIGSEVNGLATHIGTRARIVGRIGTKNDSQRPSGATTYYAAESINPDTPTVVEGGSAGLAIMLEENSNVSGINSGYFYEIVALDTNNIAAYSNSNELVNVIFYKTETSVVQTSSESVKVTRVGTRGTKYNATYTLLDSGTRIEGLQKLRKNTNIYITDSAGSAVPASLLTTSTPFKVKEVGKVKDGKIKITVRFNALPAGVTANTTYNFTNGTAAKETIRKAMPKMLWSGLSQILVDDGLFTGQYRLSGQEKITTYDLAIEYIENYEGGTKFFLYLNNRLIGSVIDQEPLKKTSKIGMFVRGSTRAMFEKIYAIKPNRDGDTVNPGDTPLSGFADFEKQLDTEFASYKQPSAVTKSYLESISPIKSPRNDIYLDEFGSILREVAYFNVKYDKAYPAFSAKIAPTFNKLQGYAVAGFVAGAYKAEFLVFNITDSVTTLDAETGNYLRILGVTFTQQSDNQLTVDEYFDKNSNFAETELSGQELVLAKEQYQDIKSSRITYGLNEFNVNAPYIQSQDSANSLMSWMISKIMKPRKSVGINIFANPMLQLGDIVQVNYEVDGKDQILDPAARFVVYNIDYSRSSDGPSMTVYLSEVK